MSDDLEVDADDVVRLARSVNRGDLTVDQALAELDRLAEPAGTASGDRAADAALDRVTRRRRAR